GHPTIGTTFALAREGWIPVGRSEITLALGIGPTRVRLEWDARGLRFAWMVQPLPVFGATSTDLQSLATALGIQEADIRDTGLPVQEVSSGVPFLYVPLATRRAVDAVVTNHQALTRFFQSSGLAETGVFVFSIERSQDDATAYSRM